MGTTMERILFRKVKDPAAGNGASNLKRPGVRLFLGMVLMLWIWTGERWMIPVLAAEGSVSFGPESYAWNIGEVSSLELSFDGNAAVGSYEICIEYDSAVLEYLDGADRAEGKKLWLEGGGGEEEYEWVLLFRPKVSGNTVIRVISASASSETADGESVAEEEIEIDRLPEVSIAAQEAGSRLSSLEIGFAEGMEAFAPDVLEYHMQVGYEVDWLPMEYETEDEEAVVTVTGMELAVGSNVVTLEVQRKQEKPVIYTLYVERAPNPAVGNAEGREEQEQSETAESTGEGPLSGNESGGGDENKSESEKSGESGNTAVLAGNGEGGAADSAEESLLQYKNVVPVAAAAVLCMAVLYAVLWLRRKKEDARRKQQEENAIKVINLDKTVIDVRHVTMNFKLAQDESSSLKEYLIRTVKRQNHYRVFSALRDVSFEVKQGEVMGIIGTNGSGKSTLLKIIAGALIPTKGKVVVNTEKIHMLTLGTGFDMELTARENVYLNGAIIGYTKEYIDEKYNDIVAFAELEGFMDERMKNFSSGMVSRLGFAIATMRESPDILILDEVLSVGDMFFRKKSEERIQEMIHSGATVLIVSHSADFIRKNCDTAVWIEKGVMRMIGKPEDVCRAYGQLEK